MGGKRRLPLPYGTAIAYTQAMAQSSAHFILGSHRALMAVAICAAIMLNPYHALSNNADDGFVINKTGKRFYALPSDGSAQASLMGARVVSASKSISGKKQAALQGGFMHMDRNKIIGPRRVSSIKNQVSNTSPVDADAATLSLFDTEAAKQNLRSGMVKHIWPLPAAISQYVSSGYGMRNDPFHGQRRFHGGLDIAAAQGTSVLASADGRIKEIGFRRGYGNSVTITHADGSESMYNHLQKATARVGSLVRAGQEIGKLGSTGRSTGPHLDYRLKVAGEKRDPMTVLAGKAPANVGKMPTQIASRVRATITSPNVRNERGVRIITPRERLAMSGGFIKVR